MNYKEILKVLNEDDMVYTPQKNINELERLKKSFEDIYKQLNPNKRKNRKSPYKSQIEETADKFKEMIDSIEETIEREREMAGIKKKKTIGEKIKGIFKPVNEEIYYGSKEKNNLEDLKKELKRLKIIYKDKCFDNPVLAKKLENRIKELEKKTTV